jgi:hypothetical protein
LQLPNQPPRLLCDSKTNKSEAESKEVQVLPKVDEIRKRKVERFGLDLVLFCVDSVEVDIFAHAWRQFEEVPY